LVKTKQDSISEIMQVLSSRYALRFNRKYKQVGHAFQSRFHSIPVQTDAYLAEVAAYIDLNAPRARMVAHPADYPWCGYKAIVGAKRDAIVDATEVLEQFSDNPARARLLYRAFVEERLGQVEPLTHEELLRKRSWGQLPDGEVQSRLVIS
jgi:hypothetical protein